jgi:hypothetical protein
MKRILLTLVVVLSFVGCSDEVVVTEPKIVVGHSFETLQLKDQFDQVKSIDADTKQVMFAFSKDMAHLSNNFFNTKEPTFLADHHTVFIADVSAAPSLIRSMFILPGLKDFKHTVLLIDDKNMAANYRHDDKTEALMVVDVDHFIIKNISYLDTEEALAKKF